MSVPVNKTSELPPRNRLKMVLLALAAVPFVLKISYLARVWGTTGLDGVRLGLWGSAAFLVMVVAMVAKLVWRFQTKPMSLRSRTMWLLLIPLALYIVGYVLELNSLQIVASVGVLWMAAWSLYGRVTGLMLAPAVVFGILAVPGSSYWMDKIASSLSAPVEAAYVPAFSARSQTGYLGREVSPEQGARRLYRTSEMHQLRYVNPSNVVSVLAVTVGKDIHEIHPAPHCLKTSGWSVVSEELRLVPLASRATPLALNEVVAQAWNGSRILMWVWYSSPKSETGSFIRFRHLQSQSADWKTYQVSTESGAGDVESARRVLQDFLSQGARP